MTGWQSVVLAATLHFRSIRNAYCMTTTKYIMPGYTKRNLSVIHLIGLRAGQGDHFTIFLETPYRTLIMSDVDEFVFPELTGEDLDLEKKQCQWSNRDKRGVTQS